MNAQPGASFNAVFESATTGLVGVVSLGIYDGDTATSALATTDINEIGATGVYVGTRTAPTTTGQYVLIWSLDGTLTPSQLAVEELIVSSDLLAGVISSGTTYVDATTLKTTLNITGTSFDADINAALESASRDIDNVTGRNFLAVGSSDTRYYTPEPRSRYQLIDDAVTVTEVAFDTGGTNSFSTLLVEHTDYELYDLNADKEGWPWTSIRLRQNARFSWPAYERSVRVTGTFGWAATPGPIVDACTIYAARLFKRRREAPFGIVTAGIESAVAMRLSQTDPDVYHLLLPYSTAGIPGI